MCTMLIVISDSMLVIIPAGEEGDEGFEFLCLAEAYLDLSAALQALYSYGQLEGFAHEARGSVKLVRIRAISSGRGARSLAGIAEHFADELFGLPYGELLGHYPLCQPDHLLFCFQSQQGAGVSFGDLSFAQEDLYPLRQVHKPQGVGDSGPALAQPSREPLPGKPEPVHEGLVGGGGLQGAKVLPLEVLYERQLHGLVLAGLPYEDWHPLHAGFLGRPQPSLSCYELEAAGCRADDQWLQYSDLSHGGGELSYPCLGEAGSRLARVRPDRRHGQLLELQPPYALPCSDQGGETSSQTSLTHGSPPHPRRPNTPRLLCSSARRGLWACRSWGLRSTLRSSVLWCGRRGPRRRSALRRPPDGPGSYVGRTSSGVRLRPRDRGSILP